MYFLVRIKTILSYLYLWLELLLVFLYFMFSRFIFAYYFFFLYPDNSLVTINYNHVPDKCETKLAKYQIFSHRIQRKATGAFTLPTSILLLIFYFIDISFEKFTFNIDHTRIFFHSWHKFELCGNCTLVTFTHV